MTPAEGRRWKRANARAVRAEEARKVRALLVALRRALRDAKAHRAATMAGLRLHLRRHRHQARAAHHALKLRLIASLRAALRADTLRAKDQRDRMRAEARLTSEPVAAARIKLEAERRYRADMRRIEAAGRASKRHERAIRKGSHHALSQSDDTVRGNIPADLVPLWERVKGRVRGSDRKSRTEAFLQYAEEHPAEVFAVVEARTDAMIADYERRESRARRALAKGRHAPVMLPAADEGIPF